MGSGVFDGVSLQETPSPYFQQNNPINKLIKTPEKENTERHL